MNSIVLGLLSGLALGVFDVAVMIPMKEKDKRKKTEAMIGAFVERFMLGFLIPNTDLGIHYAITGVLLGLGLSIPTAVITRVYAPIIGIGVVGGLIVGLAANSVL
jgi:hypothetical protein